MEKFLLLVKRDKFVVYKPDKNYELQYNYRSYQVIIDLATEFYKNAIHVWTVSDVKKRKIAKENNLKFYELWNEKDAMKFIDKLYEEYRNNCK